MKNNIERLEEDYRSQLDRVQERLLDAMNKEAALVEEIERMRKGEEQVESKTARLEEENNTLKMKNSSLSLVC